MIDEFSMNTVSRCNELLLVSKIYNKFKVHWDFVKEKGGCSSQVSQVFLGT